MLNELKHTLQDSVYAELVTFLDEAKEFNEIQKTQFLELVKSLNEQVGTVSNIETEKIIY